MAATIEKIGSPEDLTGNTGARRALSYRAAATVVMAIGFLCPIVGILLFVIHAFVTDDHALNGVGSGLLVASIPLLLVGSHLLDRADDVQKRLDQ